MSEKDSYDYVADAVRTYWKNTFPQDVVAFFRQKYSYDNEWECHEEVIFCESDSDYETVSFLNDFCEGQTCVKDIAVIPLSEITEYYARTKLDCGMLDREKVIYGLESQLDDLQKYADNDQPLTLTQEQAQEIISLLKEQEPHEITKDEWESWKKDRRRDPLCMYWRGDVTPLWILRPEEVHEPALLIGDIKIFKGKPDKEKMYKMWQK